MINGVKRDGEHYYINSGILYEMVGIEGFTCTVCDDHAVV